MDVLIPVASVSRNDFLELKIALRSLDKCSDVDNVYIITTANIPWLSHAIVVPIDDPITDNKDKNLIRKIHLTLQKYPEINDFVLFADDYVITHPVSLKDLPDVYNNRGLDVVKKSANTKWQKRLLFTLNVMECFGKDVSCNWDSHTPLKLNSAEILSGLETIDYISHGANFTLCTLFANLCHKKRENGVMQEWIKSTCESSNFNLDWSKLLVGYNDSAFKNGLRDLLLSKFPDKSKYELNVITFADTINLFVTDIRSVAKISDLLSKTNKRVIVYPCDAISETTLHAAGFPVISVSTLTIKDILLLSRLMSKFCIVYDGNCNYKNTYIADCLNEDIDTTAMIYDPTNHSGIVNNTFLKDSDINALTNNDLFKSLSILSDTVTPSVIIKDEPERL